MDQRESNSMNSVSLLIPSMQSLDRSAPAGRPIRTLGIDLGTTNSTIAEFSWPGGGNPIALADLRCLGINQPTDVGEYTGILVPSVVALVNGTNGGIRVGEGAKRLRSRTVELGLEQGRNIPTPSTPVSSSAAAAWSRRWSTPSRGTSRTRSSSTSATRRSCRGRSPAARPSTPCRWP